MPAPLPALDPIALSAPVWLFKALDLVTLLLHFLGVLLMMGGLVLAAVWSTAARRDSPRGQVAYAIARRLPVVMTYLINFGVPPLLFVQVLYGPALYTASILVGASWIAIVFLLMAGYYLLYQMVWRGEAGKAWWPHALGALVLIGLVGRIVSAVMALMIRPDAWAAMYAASANGTGWPTGDPTMWPRYLYMVASALALTGVAVALMTDRSRLITTEARAFGRGWGMRVASMAAVAQLAVGGWIFGALPAAVRDAVVAHAWYGPARLGWIATSAALVLVAGAGAARWSRGIAFGAAGASVAALLAAVGVRDGIRDLALKLAGFDVWAQPVATNWPVVITFLIVFAAGLGAVGWLMSVAASARPLEGAKGSHV